MKDIMGSCSLTSMLNCETAITKGFFFAMRTKKERSPADLQCHICQTTYKTRKLYTNHQSNYHPKNGLKCPYNPECAATFKYHDWLSKHVERFHKDNSQSPQASYAEASTSSSSYAYQPPPPVDASTQSTDVARSQDGSIDGSYRTAFEIASSSSDQYYQPAYSYPETYSYAPVNDWESSGREPRPRASFDSELEEESDAVVEDPIDDLITWGSSMRR